MIEPARRAALTAMLSIGWSACIERRAGVSGEGAILSDRRGVPTESARLAHVRVVLVRTTHPGNIGAAARAMKTMALARLVPVEPPHLPDPQSEATATGADAHP